MADLYRKSSLERISSPEQLDKVLRVTSPMSWLALIAITVMIVIITIWSFVGNSRNNNIKRCSILIYRR